MDTTHLVSGAIAGAVGAFVGMGELITRYRDEPLRALSCGPALVYVFVNLLASVLAYTLMVYFNWTVAEGLSDQALHGMRVVVAGTASMALFRSSLFTVRVGDRDIAVGPSSFLQAIMGAADRAVDRDRAIKRAQIVTAAMAELDFSISADVLPEMCLALMQNLTDDEITEMKDTVATLKSIDVLEDRVRCYLLGLILIGAVGEEGLKSIISALKKDLLPPSAPQS